MQIAPRSLRTPAAAGFAAGLLTLRATIHPMIVVLGLAMILAPRGAHAAEAPGAGDMQSPSPSRQDYIAKILDLPADNVRTALDDESRPAADRARDADEKIEALLRASGIARGMRVADLRAGDGYFAQVAVSAVKRFGKVWANNDPSSLDGATALAWHTRLEDPSTADIARVDNPLVAPLPPYADRLDIVFSRGAYHDAVARGIDRDAMNRAVFAAIAPGGKYVVVDAASADDQSPEAAARLCRTRETLVRQEVEAAGFRLVSSSKALRETPDPVRGSACGQAAKGKVPDRFLLVFEKPS